MKFKVYRFDPEKDTKPRMQEMELNIPKDSKMMVLGAIELLKEVGLHAADFSRFPQSFSGGQRQRIVIARA